MLRPLAVTALEHRFYDMLLESQFWSAEAMLDYQRSQLAQLLLHAKNKAPFYQSRLDSVVQPNSQIDWRRWSDIPIVTRRDLAEHRAALLAKDLPSGHGPVATTETSGSSGTAIAVTTTRVMTIASQGLRWRSHVWNGLDWSQPLCVRQGIAAGEGALPEGTLLGPWGPSWDARSERGVAWYLNKFSPARASLDYIVRRGCAYLNAGPKAAHVLALEAMRAGLSVRLHAITTQGSGVGEEDRQAVAEAFGAVVVEAYSSKEGGQMAAACSHGSLHINCEAALVEIVDADGQPTPVGEIGRLVVTPFFNTAQPLIRYDQGDLAVASSSLCTCGSTLPVLASIAGRQVNVFRHPDGRAVAPILPVGTHRHLNCAFLQVAQVGPNDYEIRYVPRDNTLPADEAAFSIEFHRAFFEDSRLTFSRVPEIPLTRSGKFLEYVNEYAARAATRYQDGGSA